MSQRVVNTVTPIELHPVQSSRIAAIGYHSEIETLSIQFPSGAVYRYANVTPAFFAELQAAESKGSFFEREIRKNPDLFPFARMEATEPVVEEGACAPGAEAPSTEPASSEPQAA